MVLTKYFLFMLTIILLSTSCGNKQSFIGSTQSDSFVTKGVNPATAQLQVAQKTTVKPPVDILIVYDNSPSSIALPGPIRTSIQNTIETVSDQFDYRILYVPLIPNTNPITDFSNFKLIASNPSGLINVNGNDPNNILVNGAAYPTGGTGLTQELGFKRVRDVINNNSTNGIFRQGSYLMAVLISTEDDNEHNSSADAGDISSQFTQFKTIKTNLNAPQFRFMSIVGHPQATNPPCPPKAHRFGNRYRAMSLAMYADSGSSDQASRQYPDSYDMCSANFTDLFAGINQSIKQIVYGHVYGFWPVADATKAINTDKITASKVVVTLDSNGNIINQTQVELQKIDPISDPNGNGFSYYGNTTEDTRIGPNPIPGPGEPYTGHLIRLHGTAQVTYPDFIVAKTEDPVTYYGFAALSRNPDVATIQVTINGQSIPAGSVNGWSYVGFKQSQNTKIKGPNDPTPELPEELVSGYIIQFHGTAVYSNNSSISISYKPAGL